MREPEVGKIYPYVIVAIGLPPKRWEVSKFGRVVAEFEDHDEAQAWAERVRAAERQ